MRRTSKLLRQKRVVFVIADVGKPLEWIDPADCFGFWETEASTNYICKVDIKK